MPGDAGAGTFYSAMSNIDVEIGDGNPGAVGVRARYAQHSFIAHMRLPDRQPASPACTTAGNVMEDVHFHGGDYGIWTAAPVAGLAIHASSTRRSTASGSQRSASARPDSRSSVRDSRTCRRPSRWTRRFTMRCGSRMAGSRTSPGRPIVISNEKNPQTEINMEDVVCDRVPTFARYQESGRTVAGPAARLCGEGLFVRR